MPTLKWGRPVLGTVMSKCGRFRIENWSDDYERTYALFDNDVLDPHKHDTLKQAKAAAQRKVHKES
jgi:hypothetical protein